MKKIITFLLIFTAVCVFANPPIANDNYYQTFVGEELNGNVLDNDEDLERDALTVNTTPVSAPVHGEVILNSDGTFIYIPNSDFQGDDSFVYEVCDDGTPVACAEAIVIITVNPAVIPLTVTIEAQNVLCYNSCGGTISVMTKGGSGKYEYKLSDGAYQSDNTFYGLCAGTYVITVKDSEGQIEETTITISEPNPIEANPFVIMDSGNVPSGVVSVEAIGGLPPYTYELVISGNKVFQTSNMFYNLAAGQYEVKVTDVNGCYHMNSVIVNTEDIDNSLLVDGNVISVAFNSDATFQWHKLDEKTNTWVALGEEISAVLNVKQAGKYKVLIAFETTGRNSKKQVWSEVIEITGKALSVKEQNLYNLKVYPNPVANYLIIPNKLLGNTFNIYNLQGKKVLYGNLKTSKIDVESLPKGYYFLKFKNYKAVKFLKQ